MNKIKLWFRFKGKPQTVKEIIFYDIEEKVVIAMAKGLKDADYEAGVIREDITETKIL
jgi:hypothetical protein